MVGYFFGGDFSMEKVREKLRIGKSLSKRITLNTPKINKIQRDHSESLMVFFGKYRRLSKTRLL